MIGWKASSRIRIRLAEEEGGIDRHVNPTGIR